MARRVGDRRRAGCQARALRLTVRVVVPILFIILLWYLHTHVVRIGYVPSASMEPTLLADDRILIRLDAYDGRSPQRGDIIVYLGDDGEYYVKRVIGVGGDTLGMQAGCVWVNREWLREPYIKQERPVREPAFGREIPQGELFVLGDNRNFSEDSRDIGTIRVDVILGKVTRIVWPRDRARRLEPVEYE
jgi:signal peptidase I